jgi:hypothetical protein
VASQGPAAAAFHLTPRIVVPRTMDSLGET